MERKTLALIEGKAAKGDGPGTVEGLACSLLHVPMLMAAPAERRVGYDAPENRRLYSPAIESAVIPKRGRSRQRPPPMDTRYLRRRLNPKKPAAATPRRAKAPGSGTASPVSTASPICMLFAPPASRTVGKTSR